MSKITKKRDNLVSNYLVFLFDYFAQKLKKTEKVKQEINLILLFKNYFITYT